MLLAIAWLPLYAQDSSGSDVSTESEQSGVDGENLSPTPDSGGQIAPDQPDESSLTFTFTDSEQEPVSESVELFGIWDLLRMVLVLALVVGMIYGLYFLLKRSRDQKDDTSSYISVLSSQTLPGGRNLHVIDVAGRVYLIGATDGSVNLISEIDDKPTIDQMRLDASRQQEQGGSFSQIMGSIFTQGFPGRGNSEGSQDGSEGTFSFVRSQRERLKDLGE